MIDERSKIHRFVACLVNAAGTELAWNVRKKLEEFPAAKTDFAAGDSHISDLEVLLVLRSALKENPMLLAHDAKVNDAALPEDFRIERSAGDEVHHREMAEWQEKMG